MVKNMKIGYALGGGAARGLSHIGVLKVLEEYGLVPSVIAGTSMGSLIGALYASGYRAKDIEQIALGMDWKKVAALADISLPVGGFIQGKKVANLLKPILGDLTFSQLKITYACVAVNIITGEEVVLSEGSILDSVQASIAIPGLFRPVLNKGRYLVDGGVLNVVPVSVCRQLGADYIIGVNVIPDPAKVMCQPGTVSKYEECDLKEPDRGPAVLDFERNLQLNVQIAEIRDAIRTFLQSHQSKNAKRQQQASPSPKVKNRTNAPSLWEVLSQTMTIMGYHVAKENLQGAKLVISPDTEDIGYWQFYKAAEAIAAGEKAARTAIQTSDLI